MMWRRSLRMRQEQPGRRLRWVGVLGDWVGGCGLACVQCASVYTYMSVSAPMLQCQQRQRHAWIRAMSAQCFNVSHSGAATAAPMCVCVCVCACVCVCVYICIHIHIYTHTHIYTNRGRRI